MCPTAASLPFAAAYSSGEGDFIERRQFRILTLAPKQTKKSVMKAPTTKAGLPLFILCLALSVLSPFALPSVARADEAASAPWSGFTIDQLAKHLRLSGGNIAFEFDEPVYLEIKWISKQADGEESTRVLTSTTTGPGTRYRLFIKVENRDPVGTDPDQVHKHVEVDYTIAGIGGGGWGMNLMFRNENRRNRSAGAWHRSSMRVALNEEAVLYELSDPDAPEQTFHRITIKFSQTDPNDIANEDNGEAREEPID